jgi:hypothetical protein
MQYERRKGVGSLSPSLSPSRISGKIRLPEAGIRKSCVERRKKKGVVTLFGSNIGDNLTKIPSIKREQHESPRRI